MLKLNIGCGLNKLEGYDNVDIDENVDPDVIAPAHKLPYDDNSADEILASHVLEHMPHGINIDQPESVCHPNVSDALKEWYRVLKLGGRLEIRVPNLAASLLDIIQISRVATYDTLELSVPAVGHAVMYSFDELDASVFSMMILGGQQSSNDFHKSVFNLARLKLCLEKVGFINLKRIIDCKDSNGLHPANLVMEASK